MVVHLDIIGVGTVFEAVVEEILNGRIRLKPIFCIGKDDFEQAREQVFALQEVAQRDEVQSVKIVFDIKPRHRAGVVADFV